MRTNTYMNQNDCGSHVKVSKIEKNFIYEYLEFECLIIKGGMYYK